MQDARDGLGTGRYLYNKSKHTDLACVQLCGWLEVTPTKEKQFVSLAGTLTGVTTSNKVRGTYEYHSTTPPWPAASRYEYKKTEKEVGKAIAQAKIPQIFKTSIAVINYSRTTAGIAPINFCPVLPNGFTQ